MAARVVLREITPRRAIGCCGSCAGGPARWSLGGARRSCLLSAQGMGPPQDLGGRLHRSRHGPRGDPQLQSRRLRGAVSALSGRPATDLHAAQRQEIKRIALTDPTDLGQPFATWSLAKLADYLVAEEVVADISHEGLRQLLREEDVRFQAVRSWKRSTDPDFERKRPDPRAVRRWPSRARRS